MEDKVQCQICKEYYGLISSTHLKMHGLTFQEYKELYPDAKMISDSVQAKRSESLTGRKLSEETKYKCGNGARDRVQSEEEKEKRRQSNILACTDDVKKRISDSMKATLADGSVVARTNKTKDQRQFLIRFFREMWTLEQAAYGNLVQCEICGEWLEFISGSHLQTHNITLTEYKRLYPLAKTTTEKYIKKLSDSIKGIPKPRSQEVSYRAGKTTKIKLALRHFINRRNKIDSLLYGDLIECKICGELLGQLSQHLVYHHNITIDQYKEMYPDALTIAPNISKVMACENTKKWDDPDYKKEVSKIISAIGQGISYDEWEDFATDKKYCPKFDETCRESNREKYGRRCFMCDLQEIDNITSTGQCRRLSVHHVDMNKNQGCDGIRWKLIPLCIKCHNPSHTKIWEERITWLLDNEWM